LAERIRSFVVGLRGAFSAAFGDLPDITGKIRELTSALEKGDPNKWKQIGESWGQIFGTNLGDFKNTLSGVLADFHSLAESMQTIKEAIEWISGKGRKVSNAQDAMKHQENLTRQEDKSSGWWPEWLFPHGPHGLIGRALQGGEPAPMTSLRPETPTDYPKWTGPTALTRPGYGAGSGGDAANPETLSQPMQPVINVIAKAFLNGKEIAAEVASEVESNFQGEADRMRNNAGSGRKYGWGR